MKKCMVLKQDSIWGYILSKYGVSVVWKCWKYHEIGKCHIKLVCFSWQLSILVLHRMPQFSLYMYLYYLIVVGYYQYLWTPAIYSLWFDVVWVVIHVNCRFFSITLYFLQVNFLPVFGKISKSQLLSKIATKCPLPVIDKYIRWVGIGKVVSLLTVPSQNCTCKGC